MKRIIPVAVATLLFSLSLHAQEIPERKQDEMKTESTRKKPGRHNDQLNLTADQKTEFRKFNEDYRRKMAEINKQDQLTVKEAREKKAALRKEHQSKVQGLLTEEQKQQQEKSRMEKKQMPVKKRAGQNWESSREKLGLSDDQMAKLKASKEASAEKMKTIKNDNSLTAEQKKEQFKAAGKEQHEKTRSILTEDQYKKLIEGKKGRPAKRS